MKHIAFDLGAESGRAIVGEISKGQLNTVEIHRFPTQGTIVNGSLGWDIYRIFAELKVGLKKYAAEYGDEPCTMGVDTWGVDYGLLDGNGKLCANPYHYRDQRNVGSKDKIDAMYGLSRQQMEINTLNQLISARGDNDSTLQVGEKLLFIGDLLHYFLCGETKTEYTVTKTSNMYSTVNDRWEEDVLSTFDVDADILPDVVWAGDTLGKIRPDLAKETGVSPDCVVIVPAVHDTASAAAAVPGEGENIAYISSGTWSLAGIELSEARPRQVAGDRCIIELWRDRRKTAEADPFIGVIDPDDPAFLNPDDMPWAICDYLKSTGQRALESDDTGQVARVISLKTNVYVGQV